MTLETIDHLIADVTAAIAERREWNRRQCLPHQAPKSCWELDNLKEAALRARSLLERGEPVSQTLAEKLAGWPIAHANA